LGKPPNAAWEQALTRRSRPARNPPDANQFLLDFLPFEHRMVRRDGIQLFNLRYWDSLLSGWVGARMRMPVKYDPRDLSRVFLQAPDGQHWPIPYADLGRPPITLWEHRRAMSLLREEGRAAVDEALIFEAVEAQRALVAGAKHRTLRARRAANRSAHALAHGAPIEGIPDLDVPVPSIGSPTEHDSYLPYPLEEWS
jgi:putative transposase